MTADTTSIELTGLIEFRVYLVSVAAVNVNGIGPYSETHNVYTSEYSLQHCLLCLIMFNIF